VSSFIARDRATSFAISLLPILAFVALRFLGYMKYARLGAMALGAMAASTVVFLRPRWGLWAHLNYI
jgi:uncharacterized membrane protein YfbV (UPF0208 family)